MIAPARGRSSVLSWGNPGSIKNDNVPRPAPRGPRGITSQLNLLRDAGTVLCDEARQRTQARISNPDHRHRKIRIPQRNVPRTVSFNSTQRLLKILGNVKDGHCHGTVARKKRLRLTHGAGAVEQLPQKTEMLYSASGPGQDVRLTIPKHRPRWDEEPDREAPEGSLECPKTTTRSRLQDQD